MNKSWSSVSLCLLVSCGSVEDLTGNNPIIDHRGVSPAQYAQDLSECREYAAQVDIAAKTATGIVSGAVVGGLFGAVIGDGGAAQRAAGAGSVGGGAKGVGEGLQDREMVMKRCLIGRGYRVLN